MSDRGRPFDFLWQEPVPVPSKSDRIFGWIKDFFMSVWRDQ